MTDETQGAPIVAEPPKNASAAQVEEARSRALAVVAEVRKDPGDLEVRRRLSMYGSDAEAHASETMDLLDTRLGSLMAESGKDDPVGKNLLELRRITEELNPNAALAKREELLSRQGIAGVLTRTFRRVPKVGDILADLIARRQSLQTQIDAIIGGLRGGEDGLLKDNIQLEQLYDRVREKHQVVNLIAFQAETIWAELERLKAESTDAAEQRRLDGMISKLAVRVQDLRMMEQVFEQFYASITLITDNNLELIDASKRTRSVTQTLLTVGLAQRAAMNRQAEMAEAVAATRRTTSDLLRGNAAGLREGSARVNELANDSVLEMEALKSAHEDLIAAMDEAEAARRAAAEKARANLGQIASMRQEMETRTEAFAAAKGIDGHLDVSAERPQITEGN